MFAIQIDIFVAYINISKHQLVSLANAILSVVSPKMVPKISSAVCGSISDTRAGIIQRSMTLMPLKGTTGLQETPKLRFSHIMSYLLSKHCFPGNICIFSESNMFSHIIGYHIPLSFNGFSFFSRFYTTIIPSHIMFPWFSIIICWFPWFSHIIPYFLSNNYKPPQKKTRIFQHHFPDFLAVFIPVVNGYPLVNVYKKLWKITIFNG